MICKKLGISDLAVSPFCLGGNLFGYSCDRKQTLEILCAAQDQGINFIDTADVYSEGESERIIGQCLKGRRDKWIIATKAGLRSKASPSGLGRAVGIRNKVEQSLRRLQIDSIDLYQMHHFDPDTPIEETTEALIALQAQGKIRHIGISNYNEAQISGVLKLLTPVSLQTSHNLLNPSRLASFCFKRGISLLPYGILGRGVISNKYLDPNILKKDPQVRANKSPSIKQDLRPEMMNRVQKLQHYAMEQFSLNLQHLAIAWALKTPGAASLVLGVRSVEQLKDNLNALSIRLTDQHLKQIQGTISMATGLDTKSQGLSRA